MSVGFTGTQRGMTGAQKDAFRALMRSFSARGLQQFHHGDCIGADADAHKIARELLFRIILHPPENAGKRAFCQADEVFPVKPYLVRNHEIVQESTVLLATPGESVEQLRSGTWATIRFAQKIGRRGLILYPDGLIVTLTGSSAARVE